MKKKIENQKWGVENNCYLPEEIVDIILLKLSVKDVIKCSAVCKSWNSLVKSPSFIRTHLNNQTAGDVSGLLLLGSNQSNHLHWVIGITLQLYSVSIQNSWIHFTTVRIVLGPNICLPKWLVLVMDSYALLFPPLELIPGLL